MKKNWFNKLNGQRWGLHTIHLYLFYILELNIVAKTFFEKVTQKVQHAVIRNQ